MTIKQYGGVFGRNPTFNDVTIEGQLTFDGDIDINSDLKVSGDIETTGNVIIATSGKGIDFSATGTGTGTSTSELFDDYEEGTFTPTLNQGFNGPVGYTSQVGKYTKVGDLVYFHIYIYLAAAQTRNSDALGIAGFPFASASGVINGCVWGYAGGVVTAGTALPIFYFGGATGIFYNTGGAAFTGLTLTSARPEIAISGVYKTT
jgi:hypothetical protein